MLTRDEIVSNDLGGYTITSSTVTITPVVANNLFSKFSSEMDKYGAGDTNYIIFKNTLKIMFINYFKYYADCDMHYSFDKVQMGDKMFARDVEAFYYNIYLPNRVKFGTQFAYFDLSPNETIERDYSRTEHAMTENSPINASITTLNNPSGKSQGDGTIDEDVSTTNLHNKVRAIQELAGNLTLKRIVEETLKKYVYELNKIY